MEPSNDDINDRLSKMHNLLCQSQGEDIDLTQISTNDIFKIITTLRSKLDQEIFWSRKNNNCQCFSKRAQKKALAKKETLCCWCIDDDYERVNIKITDCSNCRLLVEFSTRDVKFKTTNGWCIYTLHPTDNTQGEDVIIESLHQKLTNDLNDRYLTLKFTDGNIKIPMLNYKVSLDTNCSISFTLDVLQYQ